MHILGKQIPVWLVIVYVLALLAVVVWPCMAFSSIFMFDAPGSAQQAGTWAFAGMLVLYPIIPIGGVLGSFFAYRGEHKRLAYGLAAFAVLPVAIMFVGLFASQVYGMLLSLGPSTLRTTVP